jgi:hypothetical protein
MHRRLGDLLCARTADPLSRHSHLHNAYSTHCSCVDQGRGSRYTCLEYSVCGPTKMRQEICRIEQECVGGLGFLTACMPFMGVVDRHGRMNVRHHGTQDPRSTTMLTAKGGPDCVGAGGIAIGFCDSWLELWIIGRSRSQGIGSRPVDRCCQLVLLLFTSTDKRLRSSTDTLQHIEI